MNLRKSVFVLMLALAAALPALAQNGTMSPYTRYGYGQLRDNATAAQQSMGGVGYAMNSGRQINVMNPASYARIDSMTFLFDMGIDFSLADMKEGSTSENHYDGGLNYITMQFPLGKYMGASMGLLPYSSVGYSFSNEIKNGSETRSGGGSFNMLYAGLAARPFRNVPVLEGFSLGANISYMFGTIYHDTYSYPSTGHATLFERQWEVRDYNLELGAQFDINMGLHTVTLGAVYTPAKPLRGHYRTLLYDPTQSSSTKTGVSELLKDKYSMSESWGGGISYRMTDRLFLEGDFTFQPWSKAKYPGTTTDGKATDYSLADRYKAAVGAQFVPSRRGSYLSRINYRVGAFWNRDYIMVRDNNLREIGASVGFGLPVPSFKTMVNLGFEWRQRQAYPVQLIKENYFNITLGINFNEAWFFKNRIF